MELHDFLHTLGSRLSSGPAAAFLVMTLALLAGPKLAAMVHLPPMVGLVLAGMVVGPHGFKLFDPKQIALSALGQFGLLYLMFAAGLELDLKQFAKSKRAAIIFASLSFLIPSILGVIGARLLHYGWAATILMGTNWGSHTLVTYPLLRQMGLSRNAAVGTVVGATALTDTTSLLFLAGVSASVKKGSSFLEQGIEIAIGLVILGAFTFFALPYIARWLFARLGADRGARLVFSIGAFLIGAVIADAASIDGIVGAFLAGLGLNRVIPGRSPLMESLQFFGDAVFIPIFLISVGVLLEPKVMIDPKTLFIALVFTVAVLGGKTLAAIAAGRIAHRTWPEVGVMSGLSGSQAAATLATTLVGSKLGLLNAQTVNAVLVVILVSLVITPATVSYFGKRVTAKEPSEEPLGKTILVPIYSDKDRALLPTAARLAREETGLVLPWCFAPEDASDEELEKQRRLREQAEKWLAGEGLESHVLFRVSRSLPAGVLQTVREENVTLVLASWRDALKSPENEASRKLQHFPTSAVIVHGDVRSFERLVILARPADFERPGIDDLSLAAEVAERLANGKPIAFVGAPPSKSERLFSRVTPERIEERDALEWAKNQAGAGDVLIFAGQAGMREGLSRIPGCLDRPFLVVIAERGAVEAKEVEGPSPVVMPAA